MGTPTASGSGAGLTCEQQFLVCKAAADHWLANANALTTNDMIGASRRATNGLVHQSMILTCQLAEAVCISGRATARVAKPLQVVVETAVYVVGAIIIIAGIAYLVASIAPLVLVPIIAL